MQKEKFLKEVLNDYKQHVYKKIQEGYNSLLIFSSLRNYFYLVQTIFEENFSKIRVIRYEPETKYIFSIIDETISPEFIDKFTAKIEDISHINIKDKLLAYSENTEQVDFLEERYRLQMNILKNLREAVNIRYIECLLDANKLSGAVFLN